MRLEYAKLINYAGLERGSGLSTIEIDFTKQKHKLCLIIGKNKSGKSTLQNALHPLPDSNTSYLEGKQGGKLLRYLTDSGLVQVEIISPINSKGERGTTKGSFKKLINNQWVELNPNGNIGSYKDLIESTFGLDPSFIALSRLSSEDRGLVDKSPADRKKFVTSILENLEVYNNIGRTMTKRVNALKAMINSITNKIDSIGDEDKLNMELSDIQNKIDLLEVEKEKYIKAQSKYETLIDTLDPDKSIMDKYNEIVDKINELKESIDKKRSIILDVAFTDNIEDIKKIVNKSILDNTEEINSIEKEVAVLDSILPNLMAENEEKKQSILAKNQRLQSLQSETDYKDLKTMYKNVTEEMNRCEDIFNQMNIEHPENISKDEYILALNTLKDIKGYISNLQSSIYRNIILDALDSLIHKKELGPELVSLDTEIERLIIDQNEIKIKINKIDSELSQIQILENRPKSCDIDSCVFISEALRIYNTNPRQRLEEAYNELETISDKLETDKVLRNELSLKIECFVYLQNINKCIESNKGLLLKLPHGKDFTNISYLVDSILNGEDFSIMNDIYQTISNANIFDAYRILKEQYINLRSEMKIYQSKNEIIKELTHEIDDLNNKLNEIVDRLDGIQNDKYYKMSILTSKKEELKKANTILSMVELFEEELKIELEYEKKLSTINDNATKIKDYMDKVNVCINKISSINNQIKPLQCEKDKINYSMKMLNQYNEELKVYSQRYTLSEIIRKHSIPTTGIQLIFMKIFMGKTINMTNELLQHFFNGEIRLSDDYSIDEHEFKLPCYDIPSGITNDDISNCSTSEKCIMGMLISYVLLCQSATDYNILRLDEIDGGLDSENRMNFIPTVTHMIDILGIEQCFLISHSSETELSNVDIIMLASPTNSINIANGNIIYKR